MRMAHLYYFSTQLICFGQFSCHLQQYFSYAWAELEKPQSYIKSFEVCAFHCTEIVIRCCFCCHFEWNISEFVE